MNPKQRHFARRMIVQALYEKEISDNDNQAIIAGFLLDDIKFKFERSYFQVSFVEITENISTIDSLYTKYIDRDFSELDPVAKAILRLGTYELKFKLDIPYKVVLNEAITLAKSFGSEDSHKFINGAFAPLLVKILWDLRPIAVIVILSGPLVRSPPIREILYLFASSANPEVKSANQAGLYSGMVSARLTHFGIPPIAAISLKFTARDL